MNRLEQPDLATNVSFHGHDFVAAKQDIEKVCGSVMYTDDFKEYRKYSDDEKIEWHIGANNRFGSKKGYDELKRAFHLHPKITYNI